MKSAEFIGWALGGLEREIAQTRERLSSLTAQAARLRERLGSGRLTATRKSAKAANDGRGTPAGRRRRRGRMSAEARKRMSEMMKKRWAERRKKNA
jgi:hypothetical protein